MALVYGDLRWQPDEALERHTLMALTQALAAGPSDPVLPRTTLGDMLREAARLSPGQVALRCDRSASGMPSTFTYEELLEHSELCARRLLSDFQPGERIAIWSDNRPEWVILLFGTALAGLIVVTVNPALRPQEALYVLKQSRACACFTVPVYRGASLADIARGFQQDLAALRYVHDLEDFAAFMAGPQLEGSLPTVTPDDALMIQYTSGTTGFPKGALLLHGRLVNNAQLSALRAEVPEHCRWLSPLPLFHTGGSVLSAMGAFSRRATFVLMSAWNAEEALRLAELHRANVLCAVPTMLIAILDHPDLARRDLRSLTCIITGGAPVPALVTHSVQDRLGAEVCNVFGQTESGPVATMTKPHDTPEDKQNTVGTAMPGYEIRIADPNTGATLKLGELGEFMVRGGNMAGYFENADATREALDADGWLRSGDICSMDERGYIYVEGRIKDMIIRGGENIYPREIEEMLMMEPPIREVAVLGVSDEKWGEVVVAFVACVPGTTLDADALMERLRGRLARFKIPQRWIQVPELPRTATGKVQKFVLRDQWKSGRFN